MGAEVVGLSRVGFFARGAPMEFFELVMGVGTQFSGGHSLIDYRFDHLVFEFGLPAILWFFLLVFAWYRQRQENLPHERWLAWGFGLGLFWTLSMIVLGALTANEVFDHVFLQVFLMPLEHVIFSASLVVISAAHLRYLLTNPVLSRRYLIFGLGTILLCYLTSLWSSNQFIAAHREVIFSQPRFHWLFHLNISILLAFPIVILSRATKGWLRNTVCLAMFFFLLSEFLKLPDMTQGEVYKIFISPLRHILYLLAIPMLGYVYLREQFEHSIQVNAAFLASEERYWELFDNMSSGVAVYEAGDDSGQDFVFVDVNRAAERIENVKKEDLLGKSILEVFPGIKDLGLLDVLQRVWKTGRPEHHPVSFYNSKMSASWRENYVYKLPSGEIVAVYNDVTQRQRAAENLRESEERFRGTFEQAAVGVALVAPDGKWLRVNRKLCNIVGYTVEEMRALTFQDITHPDDLDENLGYVNQMLAGEINIYAMEKRYFHKDGATVWVNLTVSLIRDAEDNPKYFISIIEDITARKHIEEALKVSEAKYHDLYDNAPDMFVSVDAATGKVIQCNKTTAINLGYPKEEIIGRPIDKLYHPDCEEERRRIFQTFLEKGEVHNAELQLLRSDGSLIDVTLNVSALHDEQGKILYSRSIWRDISGRKAAERCLREREATLQSVLLATPTAMGLVKNRFFVWVNTRMLEMVGYTREELIGQSARMLYPSEDEFERVGRVKYAQFVEEGIRATETVWQRKDGSRFHVGLRSAALDPDDLSAGATFTAADISERKQAELQRERLLQADKMITLGTLVSGIAHEINNPNNFIMLNIPVLKQVYNGLMPLLNEQIDRHGDYSFGKMKYSKIIEKVPRLLDGILDGSRRIKNIVDELKNFARHDTIGFVQGVDMGLVVESSVNLLKSLLKRSTTIFTVTGDEDLPGVFANPQRLSQVIINLLQNACEALPDKEQGIAVRIFHIMAENAVQVIVRDEGIGMPEEIQRQIIDPFFTTKRSSGGTGLGLSVADRIVHEHQGSLVFTSEEGRGTTATMKIPVSREKRGVEEAIYHA